MKCLIYIKKNVYLAVRNVLLLAGKMQILILERTRNAPAAYGKIASKILAGLKNFSLLALHRFLEQKQAFVLEKTTLFWDKSHRKKTRNSQ